MRKINLLLICLMILNLSLVAQSNLKTDLKEAALIVARQLINDK